MYTLDLRKIGKITKQCEDYLSLLLANACVVDNFKYAFAMQAKNDFGWSNKNLQSYVIAGCITKQSSRVKSGNIEFVSSSEWLNSILTSGTFLNSEHLQMSMCYINKNMPFMDIIKGSDYISGKNTWSDAPQPLKNMLDILDDACLKNENIKVCVPEIFFINESEIEKITGMDLSEIKQNEDRIKIKWSE
ncbi:hypothetical protein [Moumouvirus maliensis]|nr:hypothetical protein [Moumouvirus maliensis]